MNWNEFSWACFLFHAWYSTDAYAELMTNQRYTELIVAPQLSDEEGRYAAERIVWFLGKYGCHTPNQPAVIDALAQALHNSWERLAGLAELEIEGIDFNHNVRGTEQTFAEVVTNLYETFVAVSHIGPTSIGKLLCILRPKLFVMWDKGIRERYGVVESKNGYCRFLGLMEDLTQEVKLNECIDS